MSNKYRLLYQFSYVKFSSTNHDANLVLLDDPSRVRSHITSVLCHKTLVLCTSFVYHVYIIRAVFARRILRSRYLNTGRMHARRHTYEGLTLIKIRSANPNPVARLTYDLAGA